MQYFIGCISARTRINASFEEALVLIFVEITGMTLGETWTENWVSYNKFYETTERYPYCVSFNCWILGIFFDLALCAV